MAGTAVWAEEDGGTKDGAGEARTGEAGVCDVKGVSVGDVEGVSVGADGDVDDGEEVPNGELEEKGGGADITGGK